MRITVQSCEQELRETIDFIIEEIEEDGVFDADTWLNVIRHEANKLAVFVRREKENEK